jgi:hypothetical protein
MNCGAQKTSIKLRAGVCYKCICSYPKCRARQMPKYKTCIVHYCDLCTNANDNPDFPIIIPNKVHFAKDQATQLTASKYDICPMQLQKCDLEHTYDHTEICKESGYHTTDEKCHDLNKCKYDWCHILRSTDFQMCKKHTQVMKCSNLVCTASWKIKVQSYYFPEHCKDCLIKPFNTCIDCDQNYRPTSYMNSDILNVHKRYENESVSDKQTRKHTRCTICVYRSFAPVDFYDAPRMEMKIVNDIIYVDYPSVDYDTIIFYATLFRKFIRPTGSDDLAGLLHRIVNLPKDLINIIARYTITSPTFIKLIDIMPPTAKLSITIDSSETPSDIFPRH